MASISISGSTNNVICSWETSGCSPVLFNTLKLYQNGSLYTSFNTTGVNHTFFDVPVGFNYYVLLEIYTTGPSLCTTATSNTITIQSFCIPSSQTNIKFSDLAIFYDLSSSNISLSGSSNPSTTGSIFGDSALPSTGTISKTRPNAVSELRNSCGGVVDVYNVVQDSFSRYTGQIAENIVAGYLIDSMPSGIDLYSPMFPGDPYSNCASFTYTNPGYTVIQTNGIYDIESIGSKTIRIAFSKNNNRTLPLVLGLSGSIVVKRLSDNATVASSTISIGANSNNTYTLSWSNSANNTKIGITISVSQNCVV